MFAIQVIQLRKMQKQLIHSKKIGIGQEMFLRVRLKNIKEIVIRVELLFYLEVRGGHSFLNIDPVGVQVGIQIFLVQT